MIKRKKYLLNPSDENKEVLLNITKLVSLEFERVLKGKESIAIQSSLAHFHYSSRKYLLNYISSEIRKKRKVKDPFCLFANDSFRIDKQDLILKMGKSFHYLNDEMRIPIFKNQEIEEINGNLKIVLKNEEWWALFTYIQKKSDDFSPDL